MNPEYESNEKIKYPNESKVTIWDLTQNGNEINFGDPNVYSGYDLTRSQLPNFLRAQNTKQFFSKYMVEQFMVMDLVSKKTFKAAVIYFQPGIYYKNELIDSTIYQGINNNLLVSLGNIENIQPSLGARLETSMTFFLKQERRRFYETSIAFTLPLVPFNNEIVAQFYTRSWVNTDKKVDLMLGGPAAANAATLAKIDLNTQVYLR